MKKPDCYQCKHRKKIAYSAHSQCIHPYVGGDNNNFIGLVAFMYGINPLNIEGSIHGISHGWFMWPINFDPIWLLSCDGFTPIEEGGQDHVEKQPQLHSAD